MVFPSVSSEPESPSLSPTGTGPKPAMAFTVSPKSEQSLHNFPLAGLKWTINNSFTTTTTTTSQYQQWVRNKQDESTQELPLPDPSEMVEFGSNDLVCDRVNRGSSIERPPVKKVKFSDYLIKNSEDKVKSVVSDGKSKVLIRFRTKNKCADEVAESGAQNSVLDDIDEAVPKTWNLRPRKPVPKPSIGGPSRTGAPVVEEFKTSPQGRPELAGSRMGAETKEAGKRKFSISLSKDEIEEDIFAITGSKPAKRPRKRAKIVQKQLDSVFPGLWLSSITPDSYRVPDPPAKVVMIV
ncbi:hypothetical protein FNV43_RR18363 [Rhamnella rubrinervis]|uniref:Uncharacterized protein n=1 Tax=Rhamnella rubrinervis TaxID=2594499 RepID=A0A8K0E652_9ROSA|nr:hypothetical protein FNV43_RR18363 [Rhamnella rubrinervis]